MANAGEVNSQTENVIKNEAYMDAFRACLRRAGGTISVEPHEISSTAFAIFWCRRDDGGLDFLLEESDVRQ